MLLVRGERLAPNLRFLAFEKRFHKTETLENVVGSVKRSGVHFYIISLSWNIGQSHVLSQFKKFKALISRIFGFESGLRETERSYNIVNNGIQAPIMYRQVMA